MGIMGAVIGLITLVVTIFVIRKLCDLIIVIAFLSALAVPFILGSGGFPEEQIILFALGLGIVMPMITLPLWSILKLCLVGKIKKLKN